MTQNRQSWLSRSPLVILAFLLMGYASGSVCTAAPITMWQDDFEKLAELIQADSHVVASKAVEEPQAPAPKPVVQPQPQAVSLSGQSMSRSSVSTTLVVGASGAGLATATVAVPQPVARRLPVGEEWLFIPPRFLDGVFRPPKIDVSTLTQRSLL